MDRHQAMDFLRALARDGADANSFSLGLADTIRRDWPDSFAGILPAPGDLIGQRSLISVRDAHLKGLQEAIEERQSPGCAIASAKLCYHARWLLYLGDPEHEASPKVSIIIPIHNRAWLVGSLIQNCLDQSYANVEIVVVDDGSSDDTAARLAAFGKQIRVIRQPNAGVSAARNAAVLAATGEFLHFLDSDNLLHAEHVEAKVRAFAAIPDADLCYCSPTDVSLFGVKPLIRFLLPGDILDSRSLARQIRTSKKFDREIVVEVKGRSSNEPGVSVRPLEASLERWPQTMFSAMLFPRSVLAGVGGFDISLGEAYQARYLFRLMAAGVSAAFIKANSASIYAMPPASSADQTDLAVLANLIQCLGDRHLWRHIPFVLRSLSAMEGKVTENRERHSLKTRLLEFTLRRLLNFRRMPRAARRLRHSLSAWLALNGVALQPTQAQERHNGRRCVRHCSMEPPAFRSIV